MDQHDDSVRRERAGRMGKFRPLPEPMRLQDLLNSARSQTEKKENGIIALPFTFMINDICVDFPKSRIDNSEGKEWLYSRYVSVDEKNIYREVIMILQT